MDLGVRKRNGLIVEFNEMKIKQAVTLAERETKPAGSIPFTDLADKVIEDVLEALVDKTPEDVVDVEEIQDLVELSLMRHSPATAKKYILYRQERTKLRKEGWEMTDLQRDIYNKKYRMENETFEEFVKRVSGNRREIQKAIVDKKFLPAGRILAGRGALEKTGRQVVLSNCFVLSTEDSVEGIFNTARDMAKTYAMGGGVGLSVTPLRPKGSSVNNAAKTTSGAVSFMELFSGVTKLIGGSGRRGALMLNMDVSHPDILDFINVKNTLSSVTGANISVNITDDFIKAVENDEEFTLSFSSHPRGESIERKINAKETMMMLARSAWRTGEPGVLFWDKVENYHLMSEDKNFKFAGVNPCGEQPLPDGGSCNLASINLSQFVVNPFTENAYFDYDGFSKMVVDGVYFLNEIIDENIPLLPLEVQKQSAMNLRQIGLGFMGLADMFIKMGIRYGSPESVQLVDTLGHLMINTALSASSFLAEMHGVFPAYNKEAVLSSPFLLANADKAVLDQIEKHGLRNSQLLTIPPTGSISTLINASNGLEPVFRISYQRKTESLHGEDAYYQVFTGVVEELMKAKGITSADDLPDYVVTADEINYRDRLAVQGAWQKYIDASISSTLNLPNEITVEEVFDIYMEAHKAGVKGITIFRDGCEREGILTTKKDTGSEIQELQQKLSEKVAEALEADPNTCPMCGGEMVHSGGCGECQDCGYSPCAV